MTQYAFFGIALCSVIAIILLLIAIFKSHSSMLYLLAVVFSVIAVCLYGYTQYCIVIPTVDEIVMSAYTSDFSELKQNSEKLNGAEDTTTEQVVTEQPQDVIVDDTPQDTNEISSEDGGLVQTFYESLGDALTVTDSSPIIELPNNSNKFIYFTITDSNGNALYSSPDFAEAGISTPVNFTSFLTKGTSTRVTITANYSDDGADVSNCGYTESVDITISYE